MQIQTGALKHAVSDNLKMLYKGETAAKSQNHETCNGVVIQRSLHISPWWSKDGDARPSERCARAVRHRTAGLGGFQSLVSGTSVLDPLCFLGW